MVHQNSNFSSGASGEEKKPRPIRGSLSGCPWLLLVILLAVVPSSAVKAQFLVATIDTSNGGYYGRFNDIIVDSLDEVHISYVDGWASDIGDAIKYAHTDAKAWAPTETVEFFGGDKQSTAIAVNNFDQPYVAFSTGNLDSRLGIAYRDFDGTWRKVYDQWGAFEFGGYFASMSSGPQGVGFHLVAVTPPQTEAFGSIQYFTNSGTPNDWDDWPWDGGIDNGGYSSLTVDSQGTPHVCYQNEDEVLMYAVRQGIQDWAIESVDGFDGTWRNCQIALNSTDSPYIAYYDDGDVKLVNKAAGRWVTRVLAASPAAGTAQRDLDIAIDSQDVVHVVYRNNTLDELVYYTLDGTSSEQMSIQQSADLGHSVSIALDSGDHPHIAYYVHGEGLRYAVLAPGIAVTPSSISIDVPQGGTACATVVLENTGLSNLVWKVVEEDTTPGGTKAAGGPDSWGYNWIDSGEPGGPDHRLPDQPFPAGPWDGSISNWGDPWYEEIPLPFSFPFYGQLYDSLRIFSAGYISFDSEVLTNDASAIISDTEPNNLIAPYLDSLSRGDVGYWYDAVENHFVIEFVGYRDLAWPDEPLHFWVVLETSGKIQIGLEYARGNTHATGIENQYGTDRLIMYFYEWDWEYHHTILVDYQLPWLWAMPPAGITPWDGTENVDICVDASNLSVGTHTANVWFVTNTPIYRPTQVPVTVNVTPPPVCQVAGTLDFGTVSPGDTSDLSFTIQNTGGGTLSGTVSSSCSDFIVIGIATYALTSGQSQQFTVRFAPQNTGPASCVIATGAPECSSIVASGTAQNAFTEIDAGLIGVQYGAAAWGDYDGDGDLDVLLTGMSDGGRVSLVYRNEAPGSGIFTDIGAGLIGISNGTVAWGDFDDDGDLDILLAGLSDTGETSRVYRNDDGAFVDIGAGLPSLTTPTVAWGDHDNDGDLDILLAGSGSSSGIYRNDDGVFVDAGANLAEVNYGSVAWGDYDNDGDLDILLVGRDQDPLIYRNDQGAFTEFSAGLEGDEGSVAWGDFDSDGDLDIALAGRPASHIYRNDGGVFNDIGTALPVLAFGAVAWGDYDNDGDLDLLLTGFKFPEPYGPQTAVYRNSGGAFTEAATDLQDVYGSAGSAAWGDYDIDGDLDILLTGSSASSGRAAGIYRNDYPISNTGPDTPTNLTLVNSSGNSLRFDWDPASDTETATPGLTYNLRIGTTPGGSEVLSPMADFSTGYRRIPAMGNVQHNTSWRVSVPGSGPYYWSVQSIDATYEGSPFAGERMFTFPVGGVENSEIPRRFALGAAVPNPFNPMTKIPFEVPLPSRVTLQIYDLSGRAIITLLRGEEYDTGKHSAIWDGRNDSGRQVAAGVYFYRFEAGGYSDTRRMTLVK